MEVIKEIKNKRSLGITLNSQYKKGMTLSLDEETQQNLKGDTFPLFLCKSSNPTELLLRTKEGLGVNDEVTPPDELVESPSKVESKEKVKNSNENRWCLFRGIALGVIVLIASVIVYYIKR